MSLFQQAIGIYNSAPGWVQAIVSASPDLKTAYDVVNEKVTGDPNVGEDAFKGIGDVIVGAVGSAIAAELGLPIGAVIAAGWVASKFGERLGKAIWDKQTEINPSWTPTDYGINDIGPIITDNLGRPRIAPECRDDFNRAQRPPQGYRIKTNEFSSP